MPVLLEVREFDRICCSEECPQGYAYLPKREFSDLIDLIRSTPAGDMDTDASDFLRIGYKRGVGDVVCVGSHVGTIRTRGGSQIQVLPKIDFCDGTDEVSTRTKRVFLRMLCSMDDFPTNGFREADLAVERMPLYEIFVSMYVTDAQRLIRHGLKSTYVSRQDNLSFCKGKLLVSEHVKANVAHRERFYVNHDEYLADRAENRLIKATLIKLSKTSTSARNQRDIRQLLASFDHVPSSTNYQADFSRIALDRSMADYDGLMRWSKVFLLDRSFSTFSGDNGARAILFPMERVFEAYVARQLRYAVADLGWKVSTQDRGYYLFDEPRKFALRPDIVVTTDDGTRFVMDTKWKRLEMRPQSNYGISQADMYQMYAYAKKYDTPGVWLLYPIAQEMRGCEDMAFFSHDSVRVRVFFVDVANIEKSLHDLRVQLMKDQVATST